MGFEESLPGRLPFPIRRRLDAVCFHDIADRPIGYGMPKVGQGAPDTVIAPRRILLSHAQDQFNNVLRDRRASE